MTNGRESLWRATHPVRSFTPLTRSIDVDVAIIGGGVSGVTAALILSQAGKRVALLESRAIASGETGNTTAHLTEAVDAHYRTLIRDFGEAKARLVAQSTRDAMAWMESTMATARIACGFERVPGYLYTEHSSGLDALADELDAALRAGCAVQWTDDVPLPFQTAGGVRWEHQAQVHATAYLEGVLTEAIASGAQVYGNTRVVGVHEDSPCRIETDRATVRAHDVFVAANVPINNRVLLHTKIAAYRSYVFAGTTSSPISAGLFWDTERPYHYIRTQRLRDQTYLIVGGEDHRTGDATDTDGRHERLVSYARQRFGDVPVEFQWSGQIIEPVDGLPFIGRNAIAQRVYVGTGYAGNGMTFGTLAGMMVSDLILRRPNPYLELYDATRVKPIAAAYDFIRENVTYPKRLVTDRLSALSAAERSVQSLRPGEGAIFDSDEGHVAVCRDRGGTVHACSAVCTHLGCEVAWNQSEQTWDCPCHGSRFAADGTVINGPAVTDLKMVPVTVGAKGKG